VCKFSIHFQKNLAAGFGFQHAGPVTHTGLPAPGMAGGGGCETHRMNRPD